MLLSHYIEDLRAALNAFGDVRVVRYSRGQFVEPCTTPIYIATAPPPPGAAESTDKPQRMDFATRERVICVDGSGPV